MNLLPCPFCGAAAELDTQQGYRTMQGDLDNRIVVYCTSCPAEIGYCRQDVPEMQPEQVVSEWNKRGEWSKDLPDDSGLWWHWNEDEDCAPISVAIAWSGTANNYFAMAGQYGWTRAQDVEEMGGWWMKIIEPQPPER